MSDTKTIGAGDTLTFAFKWRGTAPGPWLTTGQTIATRTVTVSGGLVKVSDSLAVDDVLVTVTAPDTLPTGTRCAIQCRITTNDGQVKTDEMPITVQR